jgi:hypothetical protein
VTTASMRFSLRAVRSVDIIAYGAQRTSSLCGTAGGDVARPTHVERKDVIAEAT